MTRLDEDESKERAGGGRRSGQALYTTARDGSEVDNRTAGLGRASRFRPHHARFDKGRCSRLIPPFTRLRVAHAPVDVASLVAEPTTPPLPGTTSSPALFSTQKPARAYCDARRGFVLALALVLAACLVRLVADPHAIGRSAVPGVMSSQVVHALAHFSSAATAPPCIPPPQFPIPALPGCVSPFPDSALVSHAPRNCFSLRTG